MIKRTIEVSREPVYLSVKNRQLVVRRRGAESTEPTTIPCEDIGLVLIDEPATIISLGALVALVDNGAALAVCGPDHLPAGLLLPISGHTEVVARLHEQISVRKPLKKRLWQQIVVAKVRAQASNLKPNSPAHRKLLALARKVKSGDPSNIEAQAAKVYWRAWLGHPAASDKSRFRRNPDGPAPNNLLNYGYAIVRAGLARALVSAGLQPALGIHHSNRSNAFCLADDLVEPLRPIVDARVRGLFLAGENGLDQPTKAALLGLLTTTVHAGGEKSPLTGALHRMVASLARCYAGSGRELLIPVVSPDEA